MSAAVTVIAPPMSSRASLGRAAGGGEEDDAEGEDRDSDRDVDEEDPVPGQEIREDPAEEHADGASAGRDEAEHAHRFRAVSGFGEESHDQRERDCRDDRAAEALDRACGDEQALRGGEPACERGDREERDAVRNISYARRGRQGVLPEAGSLRMSAGRR